MLQDLAMPFIHGIAFRINAGMDQWALTWALIAPDDCAQLTCRNVSATSTAWVVQRAG